MTTIEQIQLPLRILSMHSSIAIEARERRWAPSRSLLIFFGIIGYLVLVKLLLMWLPSLFRSPAQAAVFEWRFFALWAVLGSVGVHLSEQLEFPAAWRIDCGGILLGWPLALG